MDFTAWLKKMWHTKDGQHTWPSDHELYEKLKRAYELLNECQEFFSNIDDTPEENTLTGAVQNFLNWGV